MTTATLFDPAAIKQECERMMEVLRRERSSEEELADASEVDREIERLKRELYNLPRFRNARRFKNFHPPESYLAQSSELASNSSLYDPNSEIF
ncbi:unnamed protein product [Haemonchus placei]|uniref:RabBD domain-containing protein n=1 Tax=Haemonchus placei TaxID=6290 RepID=A0A0N4X0I0_HAEPC|nr:unnamed protein product [Haemonchus placei]